MYLFIAKERKRKMAQRLLLLSYGDQLHKCHLATDDLKKITVGNDWSDTVTFLDINISLSIEWTGEECKIGEQSLRMNEHVTIKEGNRPLHLYLIDDSKWHMYDTSGKYSLTIGSREYDDVFVKNTSSDLVLIREKMEDPFRLEVNNGPVYHNFVSSSGACLLEPGDQLFIDGIMIKIGKDAIELLDFGNLQSVNLVELYIENEEGS